MSKQNNENPLAGLAVTFRNVTGRDMSPEMASFLTMPDADLAKVKIASFEGAPRQIKGGIPGIALSGS